MQITIILTALSFGIGAHAWAQAANGEWIANNELGWDYNSGCKLSLPAGLIVWRCPYTQTCYNLRSQSWPVRVLYAHILIYGEL
jgi:hypothetical protein